MILERIWVGSCWLVDVVLCLFPREMDIQSEYLRYYDTLRHKKKRRPQCDDDAYFENAASSGDGGGGRVGGRGDLGFEIQRGCRSLDRQDWETQDLTWWNESIVFRVSSFSLWGVGVELIIECVWGGGG